MAGIAGKIMKRVRSHGRGKWVGTPKDFLDLGSRAAVDQALSRLVTAGQLRRVGRGLYDMPRISGVLKRPAPASIDAAIAAVTRRDNVRIMPDGLVAANLLGLTNAVPAKAGYVTDGATKTIKIDGRTIRGKPAARARRRGRPSDLGTTRANRIPYCPDYARWLVAANLLGLTNAVPEPVT